MVSVALLPQSRRHPFTDIARVATSQRHRRHPGDNTRGAHVGRSAIKAADYFGPGELNLLRRTFDDVWRELRPHAQGVLRDLTRETIGKAIMQAAMAGERDPEVLWCQAMIRAKGLATVFEQASDQPPKVRASKRRGSPLPQL